MNSRPLHHFSRLLFGIGLSLCTLFLAPSIHAQVMTGNGFSLIPHILPIDSSLYGNGYYGHTSGQSLTGAFYGLGYQINSVYPQPSPVVGGISGEKFVVGNATATSSPTPSPRATARATPTIDQEQTPENPISENNSSPIPSLIPGEGGQMPNAGTEGDAIASLSGEDQPSPSSKPKEGNENFPRPSPATASGAVVTPTASPSSGIGKLVNTLKTDLLGKRESGGKKVCSWTWLLILLIGSVLHFALFNIRREKLLRFTGYMLGSTIIILASLWQLWHCTWYYLIPIALSTWVVFDIREEEKRRKEIQDGSVK